jgi:hypothetical protein
MISLQEFVSIEVAPIPLPITCFEPIFYGDASKMSYTGSKSMTYLICTVGSLMQYWIILQSVKKHLEREKNIGLLPHTC